MNVHGRAVGGMTWARGLRRRTMVGRSTVDPHDGGLSYTQRFARSRSALMGPESTCLPGHGRST